MTQKTIKFKSLIVSFLTLALILITSQALIGRNYYFSTSIGDDTRTSTQAQNPSTPWKTITKLNSFFTSFVGGDSVLFKRGDTFYGGIIANKSGTSSLRIVIGAFGTGANPIISGFTQVSAWTNRGNNIWESTNAITTLSTCNMVTIGEINTPKGRTPNTDYYYYQSHSGTTQITSNNLTGTPNWSGAELAFCNTTFTIARVPITSQSGSTLTFTPDAVDYSIQKDGLRFIIQNDLRTLDSQNEWYFNPTTKKISIYSVSQPVNVKVSTVDYLVNQSNTSYITVSNINFTGSNSATFYLSKTNYLTIKNCNMTYAGNWAVYGIYNKYSDYLIIENCNIDQSNNGGIGITSDFRNATIRSNTITNTGMIFGAFAYRISTGNGTSINNGISALGVNTLIENNSIQNTGYIGIRFKGDNTTVQNNFIDGAMKILRDGGGIYTNNTNAVSSSNLKVLNNIILNCSDDCGLYFDDKTNHLTAIGNTISGCKYGIYMNNAYNNIIRNNTAYNNPSGALLLSNKDWANQLFIGNIVNSNKFIAKGNTDVVIFIDYIEKILPGMSSDSNYYCRPMDDNTTTTLFQRSPSFLAMYQTLAQWKTYSGKDAHSNKSPKSVTSTNDLRFEYNSTNSNKSVSLDASYIDVTGKTYSGTITLTPHTSAVLIKTGTSINQPPSINNQGFQINKNSPAGTTVGTVVASDPDAGQTLAYSIISGNTNSAFVINASTGVLSVANSAALGTTNYSVFQSVLPTITANNIGNGTKPIEVGMKFSSNINGYILGLRYYKGIGAQGTHLGSLWSIDGTRLASATFSGETASGWQTVTFTAPIAITANTIYIVSYFSPNGDYVFSDNYFTTNSITNGPLMAKAATLSQPNGVNLGTASSAFPIYSYKDRNYWADVIFSSTATSPSSFSLIVKVQDNGTGNLSTQATVTINLNTVKSLNALNITSIPPDFVSVGSPYRYEVTGSSADENRIDFTAVNLPNWLHFTDNGNNTGTLEGIPGIKDIGSNQIIVDGKDLSQSVQQVFTLQVKANPSADILKQIKNGMHIYPNPVTNGKLNIELTEEIAEQFELYILDVTGKLLLRQQYEKARVLSLDVSSFPPALYLIQIRSDRFLFSDKFIIR